MKFNRNLVPIIMFALVVAVFSGCPAPVEPTEPTAASVAAALRDDFATADADEDEKLTLAEAQAANANMTEAFFNEIDTDGDDFLTLAELEAAAPTGGEGEGEGEGEITLNAVSTKIEMHQQGMIKAGDDVIAYGYGGFAGVGYIIPSTFETGDAGLGIAALEGFQAGNFEVAGKKIALVKNLLVSIFDTETETLTEIPEEQVRLITSPSGQRSEGTLQADGNLIIVRNEDGDTGNHAAIIDVSEATPVVIGLASPTGDNEINSISHAVVDANTRMAVGTAFVGGMDAFVVWDLDAPNAEPAVYTFEPGIDDALFKFEGDFLLFHDTPGDGEVNIVALNLSDGMFTSGARATGQVALNGGKFLYFLDRAASDGNGGDNRSAIGTLGSQTDITTFVAAGDAVDANFIDGSTTNNGVVGWGQFGAITDDGGLFFTSGFDSVGSGEYLQVSNGGRFSQVSCVTCIDDDYGTRGTNVDINGKTLAFKNGDNSGLTHVSFIILP